MDTLNPKHSFRQSWGRYISHTLDRKARNGGPVGCAPTGYINARTQEDNWAEIDAKLGPLVTEAFALATKGISLRKILNGLTPKGLVSRNGTPLAPSALLNILTNPFYVGCVRYKGKIYLGTHTPLVSQELFERVQHKFKRSK